MLENPCGENCGEKEEFSTDLWKEKIVHIFPQYGC
jgi:hypothetical protein